MGGVNTPAVLVLYKTNSKIKSAYNLSNKRSVLRTLGASAFHGYVINRKAAANILEAQTPLKFEIDAWEIYDKLGLADIYCTNFDYVFLDKVLSTKSLIENGTPVEYIDFLAKRVNRKILFQEMAARHGPVGKVKLQLRRVQRHLRELYYDKDEI